MGKNNINLWFFLVIGALHSSIFLKFFKDNDNLFFYLLKSNLKSKAFSALPIKIKLFLIASLISLALITILVSSEIVKKIYNKIKLRKFLNSEAEKDLTTPEDDEILIRCGLKKQPKKKNIEIEDD